MLETPLIEDTDKKTRQDNTAKQTHIHRHL